MRILDQQLKFLIQCYHLHLNSKKIDCDQKNHHPDNLLTVYANVANVSVAKGDNVAKGATIAKLRGGDDSFVHFEVRNGFDSVDPTPYLN